MVTTVSNSYNRPSALGEAITFPLVPLETTANGTCPCQKRTIVKVSVASLVSPIFRRNGLLTGTYSGIQVKVMCIVPAISKETGVITRCGCCPFPFQKAMAAKPHAPVRPDKR
jgi:hypothetical protein